MFTGELVTRVQAFVDNISQDSAANRQRRRRIVADVQEVFDTVWNHRGWRWSMGNAPVVLGAGTKIALLPSDFGALPKFGGVFVDGKPLHNLADATMNQIHQGYITASNVGYSLYGFSDASQVGTIQFDVDGPLTATLFYKKRAPKLADRPWPGYPVLADGGAGSLTGTFRYRATYTTIDGFEHEYGDTTSITITSKQVTVTGPDPGPLGEHSVSAINLYRTTNGGVIYYKRHTWSLGDAYTLTDNLSDASLVAGAVLISQSTLTRIPENYHTTVLLPGVRAMRKESQGDSRNFQADYDEGLKEMVREERPFQSEVQQMPRWAPIQNW